MPTNRRLGTAGLIVLALTGTVAAVAAGVAAFTPRGHPRQASVQEVATYGSANEMLAASDAVVRATVVSLTPGPVVGSSDMPLQLSQATLQIDEVISGSLPSKSAVLEEDGVLYSRLSKAGDHGIYFLVLKRSEGIYRLASSQGRFLDASGGVESSNDEVAWTRKIEGESFAALLADLRSAAD